MRIETGVALGLTLALAAGCSGKGEGPDPVPSPARPSQIAVQNCPKQGTFSLIFDERGPDPAACRVAARMKETIDQGQTSAVLVAKLSLKAMGACVLYPLTAQDEGSAYIGFARQNQQDGSAEVTAFPAPEAAQNVSAREVTLQPEATGYMTTFEPEGKTVEVALLAPGQYCD